ncbi:helix-turn-helix transcriptional regulator [Paenibacillus sp. WLX2291]|uniref:helix-turn-helix transcriptional regulator n=1 Tax=Paenibacillus sp. WLX2291 TaxID=3296934 RepID=UPI00398423BF
MKLERLISIIYKLLNHEVLSATVLAEEFGVSPRTIYRDMDVIGAAGFPVISHQGSNGGYGMIDGYRLDKSLLGSHDVASLVTVLHSLSTMFDDARVQGTIERLQSIEPVQQMPRLDINFQSYHTDTDVLRLLREAIAEHQVIHFDYISASNERTARDVEAVRIYFKYGAWYVYGYCRSRQDYREFRLSRMLDVVLRDEHFAVRPQVVRDRTSHIQKQSKTNIPDQSVPESQTTADAQTTDPHSLANEMVDVVIHIRQQALANGLDQFQYTKRQFHDDGSMTVRLTICHPLQCKWLCGTLLSFGSAAEVLYPPELRVHLRQQLRQMLSYYEQDERKNDFSV